MVLLYIIRFLFIVIMCSVLWINISGGQTLSDWFPIIGTGLGFAALALLVDLLTPKRMLGSLAGVFFGLLVGILISWALFPVIIMVNDTFGLDLKPQWIAAIKWFLGICVCYLVITIVIRTKDDVRFVIPYVEFNKQSKGARPLVLDTSVIIDGRIADLCDTKIFDAPLIIPRFVLNELQLVADSADKLKRNRGRRGLDMLNRLQSAPLLDIKIDDTPVPISEAGSDVDAKLLIFTKTCDGKLVTNDFNLSKIVQLREVDVININDIANALKAIVLPGESFTIKIVKPGEESQQGIGYLDDGTMVVVEDARNMIGETIRITVTSSLQTSAGKMIFGKFDPGAKATSTPAVSSRQNGSSGRK